MKVDGTRSFDAAPQVVWDVLNDPAKMAELMPGVESFDVQDERHWKANVKIPLGLGGLRMSIDFEKTEERPIEYARLNAKGNGVGAILSMDTQFNLAPEGDGTNMKWEADVRIAGPVGSMGQRVLQPIVNQQVSSVLTALEKQISAAADGGPGDAGPGTSGAEEGLSPLAPESYEPEGEGPTTSTES
jgi:carbon monoxide dehydrogenase subunit G